VTLPDDPGLLALARRIEGSVGLTLEAYKSRCLRRRIAVRMRAVGAQTYTEYLEVLDRTPGELEKLLDTLTINVTKFFRNSETWDYLGDRVLPGLVEIPGDRIRFWSAGCASGEEAYTLAILLARTLDARGQIERLSLARIDATDIDRVSLERAAAARYPAAAFSECSPAMVDSWRREVGPGEFEIAPRLRAIVRVRRLDLISDQPPDPPYQLVVCRNVVIYFDRPTQERLMDLFHSALRPGGYLVLGRVETIFGGARSRFELVDARERIYRKAG
jgi:chemotaxis methyl-accepting protein methylase